MAKKKEKEISLNLKGTLDDILKLSVTEDSKPQKVRKRGSKKKDS